MRLYQFSWGIFPRRVLIYIAEKNLTAIELVDIDMVAGENRSPRFLQINPAGTVPVLETASGELIRETGSILEYLEELYPDPSLVGTTPEARAHTRDLAHLVDTAYAFGNTYVAQLSPLLASRVTCSPGAATAMREEFYRQLANLEHMVGDSAFMGGDTPNIADISFFASAQYFRLFYRLDLPSIYPRLRAIYDRFATRPSAAPPTYPEALARIAPVSQQAS